ncbi:MAG TPA: AAA family ATPase [Terriglobales bacterium]|nr:AAA family ATPase [Terriglobales bacterium]
MSATQTNPAASTLAALNSADSGELRQRITRFHAARDRIIAQVREVIVGQDEALDQILIALFVGGHCLITGLPGTAKTLMVRTISETLGLAFRRIQFTPDLMPSDITGTDIIEEDPTTGHRRWTFVEGPIFGNVLLADEINRTPPKTQSALLEAMQERSCTVRGNHYTLPSPFFVLATQNPIELEGTYPLPEAQLDRFLFNTILDYLSADEEVKVVDMTTATRTVNLEAVTNAEEILDFQQLVRMVPIADTIARSVVDLVRATRRTSENAPEYVKKYVNFGASVRAAQFIVLASKARALARGRYHVAYEDVRAMATPVLRHRILLNFHAESEHIDSDEILRRLLEGYGEQSRTVVS